MCVSPGLGLSPHRYLGQWGLEPKKKTTVARTPALSHGCSLASPDALFAVCLTACVHFHQAPHGQVLGQPSPDPSPSHSAAHGRTEQQLLALSPASSPMHWLKWPPLFCPSHRNELEGSGILMLWKVGGACTHSSPGGFREGIDFLFQDSTWQEEGCWISWVTVGGWRPPPPHVGQEVEFFVFLTSIKL